MSMRMGRVLVFAALGGGLLGGVAFAMRARPATARIDAGPVGERIVARAIVVPSRGVRNLYAVNDGRVLRVLAREGDSVEAGQTLAELERAGQTEKLTVPERAVVLERHCEVGDYAAAAERGAPTPMFVLADPSQTELRVEVEEADASLLAPNLPVQVTPVGPKQASVAGQVTRVSARLERRSIGSDDARVRADGLVRVAAVRWSGQNPSWLLGTRAEAVLQVRRRDATLRIPRGALSVRDGRHVVEQPLAFWTREVPVDVVAVDEAYAEIRGLAPGSEVVVPDRASEP
jgi:multidrug efflux pump subunit AcrA (membrane-fusion protein)